MDFSERFKGSNSSHIIALENEISALVTQDASLSQIRDKIYEMIAAKADQLAPEVKNSLSLLAEVLWMMLDLDDPRSPYKPFFQLPNGAQTLSPDHLEEEHLLIIEAANRFNIENHEWTARLTDLLWVLRKNVAMAKLAVDSYLSIAKKPTDEKDFLKTRPEVAAERAIQLYFFLNLGEEVRVTIFKIIESKLETENSEDKGYAIIDWLKLYINIANTDEQQKIIPKIKNLIKSSETNKDWELARRYNQILILLAQRLKDNSLRENFLQKEVDLYINEAEYTRSIGAPAMRLQNLYTKAIAACGNIKGRKKEKVRLIDDLLEIQLDIPNELAFISESQDITDQIVNFKNRIAHLTFLEALEFLVSVTTPQKKEKCFTNALDILGKSPLHGLFGSSLLDEKGKILSRVGSIDAKNIGKDDILKDANLRGHVAHQLRIDFSIRGGYVVNGLLVMAHKYRLRKSDLDELMYANPFIPNYRMFQFRDGIWNGICGRWSEAIHILIPHLENALRETMRRTGYITVKVDADGVQQEKYLNDFIYETEFAEFFGEDLAFQLQVLLVDSNGINLRNNIAHGLTPDGVAYSHTAAFAWAQVVYLVIKMQRLYYQQLEQSRTSKESKE
ncbi:DUF4209 domain-containing protein [Bdellovibrio sp. HCB-162]|uniref:DUF4209 domain-containing protein n=1 Tax=Bdellovibrio sp. HCB-162 TaxID=3394234 RepID=UPI0039BCB5AC